ncbi:MAG: ABC transporter ATP-binding protein [Candidatus Omnitrophota bacterium]|jgi:ABC-type lipoprotein export system ATPase subunit
MNKSVLLEASGLLKAYYSGNKQLEILKGIDLKINKGRFAAIVGPSGAGKSTLLHILGGLDAPTGGRVLLDNEDIYRLSDRELSGLRNRRIGFVFQFYHLLPEFTALENISLPALIKAGQGSSRADPKKEALRLLEQVGLKERGTHFPSQLSGGEQQRVAIARALVNKPDLLLCDEPTGNLDSNASEGIIALLQNINRENNTSVIMVTHNRDLAKIAEEIYHLKDGILINQEVK